jgi:hypothetical protein
MVAADSLSARSALTRRIEGLGATTPEAYGEDTLGKGIPMSFMLYFLIPLFVVIVGAVVYDVRRRHTPPHDIESAARSVKADAEARRAAGGH